MPTEVERVEDWRQAKRDAGYELTTLWLRREDKRYLEDLARARHQSLSDCVLDGLRALPSTPRTGKALRLVDESQLAAIVEAALAKRVGTPEPITAPEPSATMPMCRNGLHPKAYPGECRACRKVRMKRNNEVWRAKRTTAGVMQALETTA